MAKKKQVTIDALLNLNTNLDSLDDIRKKLVKIFSDANIDSKFANNLLKTFDKLEKQGKEIFNLEFDPKDVKITKSISQALDKYKAELNEFVDALATEEMQKQLLPTKQIDKELSDLNKKRKQSEEQLRAEFEKTGRSYSRFKPESMDKSNIEAEKVKKNQEALYQKQMKAVDALNEKLNSETQKLSELTKAYDALEKEKKALPKDDLKNINAKQQEMNALTAIIQKTQTKIVSDREDLRIAEQKTVKTQALIVKKQEEINLNNRLVESYNRTKTAIEQNNVAYDAEEKKLLAKRRRLETQTAKTGGYASAQVQETIDAFKNQTEAIDDASKGMDKHAKEARKAGIENSYLAKELAMVTSAAFLMSKAFEGFRYAVNTVSKLDETMTGIAIVTGQTREQMWQMESTFSEMANRLGTTMQNIADASLLFYQQGLNTEEVLAMVEASSITASLAGIKFADASDRMTAAVRGFNLEMSEAMNVADTFSSLAAYTAADVNELTYALTKTASIANTAMMSLENTTAFLAKMIETTREAPENIGTAMKSIIARMAELKSSPMAVLEDGVDANRVQTALKAVDISLMDTSGEMRALDDVLIELGKKWEFLDRNTQSYLATIIAGNRQQSRFLALMSDFDRTMEMVEMSNNAAGESAAMFSTYLTGTEAATNKLTQAQQNLANAYIQSDWIISFKTGLANLLTTIASVPPVITILTGAMAALAVSIVKTKLANGLLKDGLGITSVALQTFTKASLTSAIASEKSAASMFKKKFEAIQESIAVKASTASTKASTLANLRFSTVAGIAATSLKTLSINALAAAGSMLLAAAPMIALTAGITAVVAGIGHFVTYNKRQIEGLKESISSHNEMADAARTEIDAIDELGNKYLELAEKVSLSADERKTFIETQNELAAKFPELIAGFDEEGNAIIKNTQAVTDAIDKETKKQAEIIKKNRASALEDEMKLIGKDEWGEDIAALEKERDKIKAKQQKRQAIPSKAGIPAGVVQKSEEFSALDKINEEIVGAKKAKVLNTYRAYANDISKAVTDTFEASSAESGEAIDKLMMPMTDAYIDSLEQQYGENIDALASVGTKNFEENLTRALESAQSVADSAKTTSGENLGEYIAGSLESFSTLSANELKTSVEEVTNEIDKAYIDAASQIKGLTKSQQKTLDDAIATGDSNVVKATLADLGRYSEEAKKVVEGWNLQTSLVVNPVMEMTQVQDDIKKAFKDKDVKITGGWIDNLSKATLDGVLGGLEAVANDKEAFKKVAGQMNEFFSMENLDMKAVNAAFEGVDFRDISSVANLRNDLIELTDASPEAVAMIDKLIDSMQKLQSITFTDTISMLTKAMKSNEELQSAQDQIVQTGGLTPETVGQLTAAYPQLIASLQASTVASDKLTISFSDLASVQANNLSRAITNQEYAVSKMQMQYDKASNTLIKNANEARKTGKAYKDVESVMLDMADGSLEMSKGLEANLATLESTKRELEGSQKVLEMSYKQYQQIYDVTDPMVAQLQNLSSGYSSAKSAIDEFNETGSISIDTALDIMANEDEWYRLLTVTNGQIQLNTEEYKKLQQEKFNAVVANAEQEKATIQAKINDLKALRDGTGFAATGYKVLSSAMSLFAKTSNAIGGAVNKALGLAEAVTGLDLSKYKYEEMSVPNLDAQIEALENEYKELDKVIQVGSAAGTTAGKGGSMAPKSTSKKKEKDPYKAQVSKYYLLEEALKSVEEQLDRNKQMQKYYEDDTVKTNELLKQQVTLMELQQKRLHDINEARRKDIQANVAQLRSQGYAIEYNASTNDLLIKNMDLLAKRSGDAAKAQDELIKATIDLNNANKDASSQWQDVQNEIKKTKKTFQDLLNEFKNSEIEKLGWMMEDIENERRNDKDLKVWQDRIDALEKEKEALEGIDDELKQINEDIENQKQLIKDLENEKTKAVYHEDLGWVWEADQQKITEAEKELEDLEKEKEKLLIDKEIARIQALIDKREKMYQDSLDNLQLIQDNLQYEVDVTNRNITMSYEDLKKAMEIWGVATDENLKFVDESFKNLTTSIGNAASALKSKLDAIASAASSASSSGGGGSSGGSGGGSSSGGKSNQQKYLENMANGKKPDGSAASKGEQQWAKEQLKDKKYDTGGLAYGKGFMFKDINSPELVLGPDTTSKVLDPKKSKQFETLISSLDKLFLYSNYSNILKGNTMSQPSAKQAEKQVVVNNFDKLVLPNVTDGKSFVNELNLLKNLIATNDNTIF